MVELVDEAELKAARERALVVGHLQRVLAVEEHLARVRLLEQTRDMQQRGLARTRRTDQAGHLAGVQIEIDAAQDVERAVAGLVAARSTPLSDSTGAFDGRSAMRRSIIRT